MTTEDTYEYLFENNRYTKEQICRKYSFWYNKMLDFIQGAGLEQKVRIDRRKLGYAVLSYYADTYRMKMFHELDKINLPKVYGYSAYWILRMAPLQLADRVEDNILWVNEKFVVSVLISNMFKGVEPQKCDFKNYPSVKELAELLYYNFKYRTYNAQTLELMLKGVYVGADIGR